MGVIVKYTEYEFIENAATYVPICKTPEVFLVLMLLCPVGFWICQKKQSVGYKISNCHYIFRPCVWVWGISEHNTFNIMSGAYSQCIYTSTQIQAEPVQASGNIQVHTYEGLDVCVCVCASVRGATVSNALGT